MGRIAKFFVWVLMVLLFLCAVLGGALYLMYRMAAPEPSQVTASFAGAELKSPSVTWTTPVLGDLFERTDETQGSVMQLGTIGTAVPELAVTGADVVSAEAFLDGQSVASVSGSGVLTLPANGTYTLRVTAQVTPKRANGPRGTYVFEAEFTLKAVPQITVEPASALQGDVVVVRVEGILDGSVPTIETELSPAYFVPTDTGYEALLGVHYNKSGGEWPVTVTCGDTTETLTVTVSGASFEKVTETLSDAVKQSAAGSAAALKAFNDAMYGVYGIHDGELYFDGQWKWPVGTGVATVPYGAFVTDGATGEESRHTGIDLSVSINTPVTAPAAGRVVYAGWLDRTGGTVVIEHGAGIKSYLFHLAEVTCSVNDMVAQGTQVGVSGIAGYTEKPHVHFEVRMGNQSVDPAKLVNGSSAAVK